MRCLLLLLLIWPFSNSAQTNQIDLSVPSGTILQNTSEIHFDGTIKPITIVFSRPQNCHIEVRDFLYNAQDFMRVTPPYSPESYMAFRWSQTLKVYAVNAHTNFDAQGNVTFVNAVFDCRVPPVSAQQNSDFHRAEVNRNAAARLRVPEDVYEKIAKQAAKDWPTSFERQEYEIEHECIAWRKLHIE